jgi:hypothetical protein
MVADDLNVSRHGKEWRNENQGPRDADLSQGKWHLAHRTRALFRAAANRRIEGLLKGPRVLLQQQGTPPLRE